VQAQESGPVQNANTGLTYSTIQEAKSAQETTDGDVIYVDPGTYYENLMITKAVELHGSGKATTIIDGGGTKTVVSLAANRVIIIGFTIQNGSRYPNMAGISMTSAHYCNIADNNIIGTTNGITLSGGSDNRFAGNTITDCETGVAIQLMSTNNVVTGNYFEQNSTPVYVKDSNKNIITANTMDNSTENGVYMSNSNQNSIIQNTITLVNSNAVVVSTCSSTIISFNTVTECNADAFLLQHSTNTTVNGNELTNNAGGLLLTESSNNKIFENTIQFNNVGVTIRTSNNCEFYGNNFLNNTRQVNSTSSTNSWDNGFIGNHWSDYHGNYTDGKGTTPYIIDTENQDNYPLQNISVIPEFSTVLSLFVVTVTLFTVVVVFKQKLRNNHRTPNPQIFRFEPLLSIHS
jgi:parallel beta-helix repeat protein